MNCQKQVSIRLAENSNAIGMNGIRSYAKILKKTDVTFRMETVKAHI